MIPGVIASGYQRAASVDPSGPVKIRIVLGWQDNTEWREIRELQIFDVDGVQMTAVNLDASSVAAEADISLANLTDGDTNTVFKWVSAWAEWVSFDAPKKVASIKVAFSNWQTRPVRMIFQMFIGGVWVTYGKINDTIFNAANQLDEYDVEPVVVIPSVAATPHKFWRITYESGNYWADNDTTFRRLRFFDSSDVNLATAIGGVATATSQHWAYPVNNMFFDSSGPNGFILDGTAKDAWAKIEFNSPVTVAAYELEIGGDGWDVEHQCPSWSIQCSDDDVNWSIVAAEAARVFTNGQKMRFAI